MFFIGMMKTLHAFAIFFGNSAGSQVEDKSDSYEAAVMLIRSVDAFLLGLFLIVFSYSIYALFLKGVATDQDSGPFHWLKMDSLDQLKTTLAQLVIVILFVLFLDKVITSEKVSLGMEDLVLPIAILCLSAAKHLLSKT